MPSPSCVNVFATLSTGSNPTGKISGNAHQRFLLFLRKAKMFIDARLNPFYSRGKIKTGIQPDLTLPR